MIALNAGLSKRKTDESMVLQESHVYHCMKSTFDTFGTNVFARMFDGYINNSGMCEFFVSVYVL